MTCSLGGSMSCESSPDKLSWLTEFPLSARSNELCGTGTPLPFQSTRRALVTRRFDQDPCWTHIVKQSYDLTLTPLTGLVA